MRPASTHRGLASVAAAVLFATCAQAWLLFQVRDYTLLGWDTYPQIASSRIEGIGDFIGNFTEDTSDGVYPESFYRPVFNFSLAADYAIWGIEPFGYHLTDALASGLCALALFALARRLLGARAVLGPWAALLVFVFLPAHVQILPLPSRRMDVLCGLFTTLALAAQIPRLGRTRPPGGVLPAFWTLLAAGSKELGAIVPPLVFWLVFYLTRSLPVRERLRKAGAIALSHGIAVALVFAARFGALGELGGHASTELSASLTGLPEMLGLLLVELTALRPFGAPPPASPPLLAVGSAAILAFAACVAALARTPSARREPAAGDEALVAGALALTWLLGIAAIQAAMGFVRSWHLLMPALAFGLLVGAVAHRLRQSFEAQRTAAAVGLAIVALWIGWEASRSPLLRDYTYWSQASGSVERYLDSLSAQIDTSPDGTAITAPSPPLWLPAPVAQVSAGRVTSLHVYSLPSWAALRHPGRRIEFRHRRLASTSAEPAAGQLVVKLRNSWATLPPAPRGQ